MLVRMGVIVFSMLLAHAPAHSQQEKSFAEQLADKASQIITIPAQHAININTRRNAALNQRAIIVARSGPVIKWQVIREGNGALDILPDSQQLTVTVYCQYHYFERGWKDSPGARTTTADGGKIIVVGCDDNGRDDDGDRDMDFNDLVVMFTLKSASTALGDLSGKKKP